MSNNQHEIVQGKLITGPFLVFAALAAYSLVILFERFSLGLGAVANINDGYPWGIWVVVDVAIGSAFGCAGYVIALVVYILNRGEYHPLVRPALMASLFGYGLAGLAVIIDLGRYWQAYNMFLPWYAQPNSVMMEVGWCVGAYTIVLVLEFMPAFLERFGKEAARRKLNRALFIFIALGVLLPTMHQSSLGTLLVPLGYQISPLWQTQMLPILFLTSAMLMGFGVVIGESVLASWNFKRPFETDILSKLSGLMVGLIAVYLILRFADLIIRGELGLAFAGDLNAFMFWVETFLFVSSMVLVLPKANRSNLRALFLSAAFILLAGSIYRINAFLIGYDPAGGGWSYFPSVKEIMLTVGIFSLEVVLYLIFVKTLPVLAKPHTDKAEA